MPFEATISAFVAALGRPSASPPAMTRGRLGEPDARRFSVYRNNVAVGLIGALEARYPASRKIAGDDVFRAIARAFVASRKPRSPVMIAYGEDFPEFVAAYLAAAEASTGLETIPLNVTSRPPQRVSSPTRAALARARAQALVGEDQGGGSRGPMRQESSDRFGGPLGLRDLPPLPAPTRGGGCVNAIDSAARRATVACLADVARLENAWVEAYHAADAAAATIGALAELSPDLLPGTRIAFHPAARLSRFSTPAASIWAAAQSGDGPAAPTQGDGEDALVTRPDADVRVRVLPPLGYDFALRLREGATLIEAALALDDPAFDFGTHLVGLVESGAVAALIPGQPVMNADAADARLRSPHPTDRPPHQRRCSA